MKLLRIVAVATVAIMAICANATPTLAKTTTTEVGRVVRINDLEPFTHTVDIPAGADLSSIRFEGIKRVKVATKQRFVTDPNDCMDRGIEGIPAVCSRSTSESYVPAFRVIYSYRAPSTASDEYGKTMWFTFSVYFREDEIGPGLRRALSSSKINRNAIAELFETSTARGSIQQSVVDEANSILCDGYLGDSGWTQSNPKCEDSIAYMKVASPSPYITVRIDPALSSLETVASAK